MHQDFKEIFLSQAAAQPMIQKYNIVCQLQNIEKFERGEKRSIQMLRIFS